ncbi:MAG: hypothetical protein AB7N80_08830 [Bdellovibrionales bacterium]
MPGEKVPERVRNFIYEYVDSVELLEILLLTHADPSKKWTAAEISQQLRSNINSVQKRLQTLQHNRLILATGDAGSSYQYNTKSQAHMAIEDLDQTYKIQRHRVLELIFSPLKKAKDFSDSFRITNPKRSDYGDENG